MSVISFGVSFILQGIQHARLPHNQLIDGVLQIDIPGKVFHFITKCQIVHSCSFGDLKDVRGNVDNKYILIMLFANALPCELHAQSDIERDKVASLLQAVIKKSTLTVDDSLPSNSIQKQAWVKKKGKLLQARRLIMLNTARNSLIVLKTETNDSLPSYFILLHHRVTIVSRKQTSIQIIGTYKSLWLSFPSAAFRDEWMTALKNAKQSPPVFDPITTAPDFEPIIQFSESRSKRYPMGNMAIARAGPSAD